MCVGSICKCHVGTSQVAMMQQQKNLMLNQLQRGMDQSYLGNYLNLVPPKNQYNIKDFARFVKEYLVSNDNRVYAFQPEPTMKITGKEYLVVSGISIVETTTDLAVAKKRAGELAHSTQGSVYIFQPVLEIAPKRDVVETSITLG